ncbi:MAG: bile acid:sodium symporter [Opitutales bacterium]|nr:bile acid:sodium symporter [Opitutales bacterium]
MKSLIRGRGFILGLATAILLAFALPEAGARGGWLQPEWTTRIGIFVIFLLQGCLLATQELWHGSQRHRLNVYVFTWCFLLYPLIAWLLTVVMGGWLQPEVRMGLIFLGLLPTTVSSAVALTQAAGGRVSASIFNTVATNLAGILWVPLISLWLFSAGDLPWAQMGKILLQLSYLIALPLVLGQLLRWIRSDWMDTIRKPAGWISNAIICFIIYAAIADSIISGTWSKSGWQIGIQAAVGVLLLMGIATTAIWFSRHWVGPDSAEQTAAFFCASQKTLATGVPMAAMLFAALDPSLLGIVLIPLIIFHPLQLVVAALLVSLLKNTGQAEGR